MIDLSIIGSFEMSPLQRENFFSGTLRQEWYDEYQNLFDSDDLRLAKNQAQQHYHFYEWAAAIEIYKKTSYLSLVEKYQYKNHKRKQQIIQQLVDSQIIKRAIEYQGEYGYVQCPDLLVYAPDLSDWYFCEVKGGKDILSEKQILHFQALQELTGKPVQLLYCKIAVK